MFRKLLSSITLALLMGMVLTGVARGARVENPMEDDLDAAGYNIFDVNDLDVDGDAYVGGDLDVIGTIIAEIFKSTGCTATGAKAVALGCETEATGDYSTAMGHNTVASGDYSTAMGRNTIASGAFSTAMGVGSLVWTTASGYCSTAIGMMARTTGDHSTAIGTSLIAGPASWTTAIGKSFTNNVSNSFAVGYGQKDFSVQSGQVDVYGTLNVTGGYKANGTAGWSGWFDDGANFRVTVTNGIITAVSNSVSGGHNP